MKMWNGSMLKEQLHNQHEFEVLSRVKPDNIAGDSPGMTGWVADEFCGMAPIGDTTGTAVIKIKKIQHDYLV